MIRQASSIKKRLASGFGLVLILLFLPVILIFLKIPAETLAGCSTYGYGCSQVACMGVEISTDQGYTWRDGTVYIYGAPGTEKYLYVRTVLGVLSGQIEGWSFGVRHDATPVLLNGGQFSLNAATAGPISTVQCGSPPDFQDTQRRPCGYTQGVAIDFGSTACKVSAPANLVTSYACYRVVMPAATGVYPVTLKLKDDVGDPGITTIVTQNGQSKVPCKFDLTLNVYSTTSYYPTPSYCPLSQGTPVACSQGQGGGGGVTVCNAQDVDEEVPLVAKGATWKFFKGTVHPSPGTNNWATLGFDDSGPSWLQGPSGFGYGDGDDTTVLADMQNLYWTVYTRHVFDGAALGLWRFNSLRLKLDFDDGMRVFINGAQAANLTLPTTAVLLHTTPATAEHDASSSPPNVGQIAFKEFDLLDANVANTPFVLDPDGPNVIAVETHNRTLGGDDLSCIPELIGFKRGPFLAKGEPTRATIAFNTLDARFGRVLFGTDSGLLNQVVTEAAATREHEITLEGLAPGTTFFYKVQAAPEASPNAFEDFEDDTLCFTTPVLGPSHQFTFAAFGDCGADTFGDGGVDAGQRQDRVADLIPTLDPQPEFYLVAGDVIYDNGERENFDARFFRYYADTLAKNWFYEAPGNHDRNNGSQNDAPFNFLGGSFCRAFVLPEGNPNEPLGQRELYYSFDWGPVHVVALNLAIGGKSYGRWIPSPPATPPDVDDKGPMRAWADADLTNSKALWKVVFFHHPPYTYSASRNDGAPPLGLPVGEDDDERIRQDFGPFFEDHKVDLVVAGHVHVYERTLPLRFNGNIQEPTKVQPDPGTTSTFTDPGAPVYIVTGGGGRDLSGVSNPQGGESFRAANAAFSEYHLTTFSVEDHRIVIRMINHLGVTRDTATIVKTRLFRRGDANGDEALDISDVVRILIFLFSQTGEVTCRDAADVDDNGTLEITDPIYLLRYLFLSGAAPPAPFPNCGVDPTTTDTLAPCVRQPGCP